MNIIEQAPWLYPALRWTHMLLVGLSLTLFLTRGLGALWQQDWVLRRGIRLTSVTIDTLLLSAGASLWALMQHNPLHEAWLATKLVLLVVYVMLGSFALKRARSQGARLACLLTAMLCAAVMIMIARTRDPLGWLPF